MKNIRFGIDLGIGSVGWAVLSERETIENGTRNVIEDFGARVFEVNEDVKSNETANQQRRKKRGTRRLIRRREHRLKRLDYVLDKLRIIDYADYRIWFAQENPNMYKLRVEALERALSGNELAACIKHIAKHRGYREFYDNAEDDQFDADDSNKTKKQTKRKTDEEKDNESALLNADKLMAKGYRTPAEMFYKDEVFKNKGSDFPRARNRDVKAEKYLVRRELIEKEFNYILEQQGKFFKVLNDPRVINGIKEIIFSQRDFETGPGNENDSQRKYKGFIDTLGNCMFYTNRPRAFRYTPIADIFAVINNLSQYRYCDAITGEIVKLSGDIVKQIIKHIIDNAEINHHQLDRILRNHNIKYTKFEEESISKQIKYLKAIKVKLESAGYNYKEFAAENQLDLANFSKLYVLGQTLSSNITPKRRRSALMQLPFYKEELIEATKNLKFSGTANVCLEFMLEAIDAFINGEIYGDFQARKLEERKNSEIKNVEKTKYLPLIDDPFITINPIVFRAVNEARRIINALIRKYGSPSVINIEVASEMNKSIKDRKEMASEQRKKQKDKDIIRKEISVLFNIAESEISPVLIDKYKLYKEQKGKCLYSGAPININELNSYNYQIDHIIPYSLILDNTLNNKVLVYSNENQLKGQRVPLMYLEGKRRDDYVNLVNTIYKNKKEYKIKYDYLMLKSIYGKDADSILNNWKSRNINDTRYIAKYVINYVEKHLQFDDSREGKKNVYGIKGGITAMFRKEWLDRETWAYSPEDIKIKEEAIKNNENQDVAKKLILRGLDLENDKLIKNRDNNLHHAIDAIIIANLTPAYVEIALDKNKLKELAGREKNYRSVEYQEYLNNCINKMRKHYYFNEEKTLSLLQGEEKSPSFLTDIRKEVNIRLNDYSEERLKQEALEFYGNIPNLSEQIRLPLISAKVNHKLRGNIQGSENPLKIRVLDKDGAKENHLYDRVKVDTITIKDVNNIVTGDYKLIECINTYFNDQKSIKLSDHLAANGYSAKKLTIDKGIKDSFKIVNKGINNHMALCTKRYYCFEIYKTKEDKTGYRAIRYIDLIKENGKIYLNIPYPDDYKEHVMYLMKNDYIEISKLNVKGQVIGVERGYYQAIDSINQGTITIKNNNNSSKTVIYIKENKVFKKYYIDPLGYIGGEIKCSGLSLYPKANG